MQPATDIVTGGTAFFQYFMMTTATAKIPGPALLTGLLVMDMS
jgi:hypothetical protein